MLQDLSPFLISHLLWVTCCLEASPHHLSLLLGDVRSSVVAVLVVVSVVGERVVEVAACVSEYALWHHFPSLSLEVAAGGVLEVRLIELQSAGAFPVVFDFVGEVKVV